MAESDKDPKLQAALDGLFGGVFGRVPSQCIASDICVMCGNPATEFADEISRREFSISGMCQKCQDNFFGNESDADEH